MKIGDKWKIDFTEEEQVAHLVKEIVSLCWELDLYLAMVGGKTTTRHFELLDAIVPPLAVENSTRYYRLRKEFRDMISNQIKKELNS